MTRIAINGCGRIGRTLIRHLSQFPDLELVAINSLADLPTVAHLLKYDSIHGKRLDVKINQNSLQFENQEILYFQEKDPEQLPWKALNIEVVIDATGVFKTSESLTTHLKAGAKKVILSAPSEDPEIPILILGVNDQEILAKNPDIISSASCTSYSAAPLIHLIDKLLGIESAYISTVHAYTSDQKLHDAPHKDLRRARAAALSIIPTTTGAAKVMDQIFPHLKGKLAGCGFRVPVPNASLSDLSFVVKQQTSVKEINAYISENAQDKFKNIIEYSTEPLVSVDILGNTHACIFDAALTYTQGNLVKLVAWYDNEVGYSCRLLDLVRLLSH